MEYEWLKEEAQRRRDSGERCSVQDLIARSPGCDPFYQGTPGDWEQARWWKAVWDKLGLDKVRAERDPVTGEPKRVHLRRVHYLVLSRSADMPPITWGEKAGRYRASDAHWRALQEAAGHARWLGLVPFKAIEDQRNPDATKNAPRGLLVARPSISVSRGDGLAEVELPEVDWKNWPWAYASGYTSYRNNSPIPLVNQRHHLEVWMEKSTVEDILAPVCKARHANLMWASGTLSHTQVFEAAERILASKRDARIFYISDFDPKGTQMPANGARRLEWFIHSLHSELRDAFREYCWEHNVTLTPLALTEAQVATYRLPRQALKPQPGLEAWQRRYGKGGVELDALVALTSGTLEEIVADALDGYYDHSLTLRLEQARMKAQGRLDAIEAKVMKEFKEEQEALEEEYTEFRDETTSGLSDLQERWSTLQWRIKLCLDAATSDIDLAAEYPVPEAAESDEDRDEALFDSDRTYDEQREAYHEYQRRDIAA